jgi:hypothetical protein
METKFLNFKKVEVTGATKDEALEKAPFFIQGDATQAYKNWKKKQLNGVTEAGTKEFMLEYLAKKSKNAPGIGFAITIEAAVPDTRERPYTFKDVKNEQGKRKYKTTYQLVDKATGEIIASTQETKAKAKEIAKNLYKEKGYKGNIICTYTKQVAEGEPVAFEVTYTPSKSSKVGTYLVFGIEA